VNLHILILAVFVSFLDQLKQDSVGWSTEKSEFTGALVK